MTVAGTSLFEVWKNLQDFMIVLKYAACELLLNFLLLIDAVFSYLLMKFAHHCKLQIPCILCSRLDHILGNKKHGFYRNQLCSSHRSEVSSLFSCCIHGKLADGKAMCHECLLSVTMKAKSNPDMHRLLVGKFGFDLSAYGFQSSSRNREFVPGPVDVRLCSCCNKPWMSRQNADKLYLIKSQSGTITHSIPLPHHSTRRESLNKIRQRFSGPAAKHHLGNFGFESLSNGRYKELKLTYDSEPEFPFSGDDDDGSTVSYEMKNPKEGFKTKRASKVAPDQLAYKSSKPGVQPDVFVLRDNECLQSNANLDRHLGGRKQANQEASPSALPELISVDFPPLSNGMESSIAVSTEKCGSSFNVIAAGRVSVERSESSGLKPLDGSSVNENEGENVVDQLKRQVEDDTTCINALYKELEEERNASAIAASQAMAMITRLQEEKAALHMEALQYLRMMEEQVEYDVEALEKANDLLAEKDNKIQDLEADLEFLRLKFPDGPAV